MEKKEEKILQNQQSVEQLSEQSFRSEVLPLMKAAMRRSYAHGLARIVQAKHTWIRLMWVAVCALCVCAFLLNLTNIFNRLWAGEIATHFDQTGEFEFPDVYLCNNHPVSGSLHKLLNDSQVREINRHLDASLQMVQPILGRVVTNPKQRKYIPHWASHYAIHSLPYRLWADWIGAQQRQSIIYALFRSTVPVVGDARESVQVTPFYHHVHPSCFRLTLSPEAADALQCTSSDSNTGVELLMFLDPANERLKSTWNSKERVRKLFLPDGSESMQLWDWSLSESPAYISPGLRVFLAPRGHYPSQFVANFLLSPGAYHQVSLYAEEDYRDHEEFSNECVNEDSPELTLPRFRDPYTGGLRTYQYSYFACIVSEWERQSSKLPELFNRSLSQLPNELEYAYNLTGLPPEAVEELIKLLYRKGPVLSLHIGKKVVQNCASKSACGEMRYKVDISSARFPGRQAAARFVQSLKGECSSLSKEPGLEFLFELANRTQWNSSEDKRVLNDYLDEAFVRLHFSVSRGSLRRIVRTWAYKFGNFVSDTGGILGLYLGMSVMILFEVIEAAYELLLRVRARRKRKNEKQPDGRGYAPRLGASKKVSDCSTCTSSSSGAVTYLTDCTGSNTGKYPSRGERCNSENRSISGFALYDYY